MSNKRAILKVDIRYLRRALSIPNEVVFHQARMSFNVPEQLEFVIEHESLSPVQPGNIVPEVTAVIGPEGFQGFR